jgi:methanethiol oxidase
LSRIIRLQTIDLGDEYQLALGLRPAHDPAKKYGFVGVVVSVEDPSASIWLWHERHGTVGGGQRDHDPRRAATPALLPSAVGLPES